MLLTGLDDVEEAAASAGADALLLKPFRPLELLTVVERLAAGCGGPAAPGGRARSEEEQLLLYARDLRHLIELERGQRALVEGAYRETVSALASALETKDTGTRKHSQRVQRYALELARTLDPLVAGHPSMEYGFLLHDIGKIGIPDQILRKPAPLTRGGAPADAVAHRARRADARRGRVPARRRRRRRALAPRALGRQRLSGRPAPERRSRSARASSRSPTRSTRSRPTGRTGALRAGARRIARSSSGVGHAVRPGPSSRPSASASTRCTRSAASSSTAA